MLSFLRRNRIVILLALAVMLASVSFAQEDPAPTLTLPVDDMFNYLQTWITTFGPILLFIGMIPVALGLLRYVVRMFQSAFGSSSR